ncbi:unnamed protein product [Kuraishia capsulata CBS 1993]|uniref:MTHFR SAM-binding regulatory domain-containing protein n=1 Tax=Kuraishia capsulata CBS 1993 TaxID=1382522 RepID=W6MNN2_9ASCO|nr:uncharacterized protein KUCA_T00003868001 [Kuraishia capsulata CBS 1993]CDK27888.1 unnamed protein product [Kuraishia capsulata CBS 1993]
MKITQKLENSHREPGAPATFSFEFFTPKTSQGVQNLYDRMDRMYGLSPQFIDITWNAGGRLSSLTTEMIHTAQTVLGLESCMHLTCTNMSVEVIDNALKDAYDAGCENILALRGDPPIDGTESTGDFAYAKDLIAHIRKRYGDHFCIGVAAYPEGHPEEHDVVKTIEYLKEKQDVGGDFIVTQMFYDVDRFIAWCEKCREAGITIPIIPGIMPISSYASFLRRAKWSEINIPAEFLERLEPFKDDDELVRDEGTKLVVEMCSKLLASGYVNHLHFYTMNLEKASMMILEQLNLIELNVSTQDQPWRKSLNPNRLNEGLRPIFWQNRKFTYITRTSNWDEFPNGRWGDSRSPAFGEVDMCDGELIRHSPKKALSLWGSPESLEELSHLFIDYLQGKIISLPWSDGSISDEVNMIKDALLDLNSRGFLTINSQPCVNGLPSNDRVHGWGPKNGYVYKKQYLEFFVPAELLRTLQDRIADANSERGGLYNILSFYAVNSKGDMVTNTKDSDINAVTWGVFPGREVVQATIVERVSFLAWKDEAFRILKEWSTLFKSDTADQFANTKKLLSRIHEDFYLVNIVDNDFVTLQNQRIFKLFDGLQVN